MASITATGTSQVTIKLKQPDYWLEGELASIPGIVIEKSFAEKQGKNYGTPAGSIMCTGAYMFKSWTPGVGVVAVRNPHYWNPSVHPLAGQITLKGVPDAASLTAGLLTGAIQGDYAVGLPTLDQLKDSSSVKVYQGPGWSSDAVRHHQPQGRAGQPERAPGAVAGAEPAGHHQLRLPGRGATAAVAVQPGHVRLRQGRVRRRLRLLAGADAEHRRGQEAGPSRPGSPERRSLSAPPASWR